MKVKIMRGNEVIHDSSKKQVAKVIEPIVEEPKMQVKITNIPKDSIFNKLTEEVNSSLDEISEMIDTRVAAPVMDDLVFRGETNLEPEPLENAVEENVSITDLMSEEDKQVLDETVEALNIANIEEFSMPEVEAWTDPESGIVATLEEVSESDEDSDEEEESYDEYDDEDEEDEMDYDQYLSNRERKQNRQIEKQNRRTDYDGF